MGGKAAFSTNFRCSRSKNVKTQSQNSSFRPPKKAQNSPKYENRCSRSMFFRCFCLKGTVFTWFLKLFRPLILFSGRPFWSDFWPHFRLFWGVPPGGPFGAIFGLILAFLGGLFGPMFSRIRPTADTNQPEPGPKPPESVSIRPDSAPTLPNSAQIPKPITNPPESAPHQPKSTRIGHSGQTFSTQGA